MCIYVWISVSLQERLNVLLYKLLNGNLSSKILFFFLLAPEKIMYEKLEEEIEMEVKGTVTIDVTLNN